ncbi:hypothetical protein MARI_31590 [Marinobacter sp. JH2]|uniref:sulfur carrier protein ThiS n=1 Tax=Marinobacter sp. AL4B TaxID=2871173 RepID=UPI0010565776|nr:MULTISPECIES: sulfur carrier protein ThiS [unclassified Marinobacter]MBZ0334979.1 sulfur carrier protein ThiS [Marinobacter sp. AL4B]QBM19016.1 hypothetical protein MARI_31590 [Marinobacter sp. JH2]
MQVQVNGEVMELPGEVTISALIEHLALTGKRVAVEVNEDIVPRSKHAEFTLGENDRVEFVHAIGGG